MTSPVRLAGHRPTAGARVFLLLDFLDTDTSRVSVAAAHVMEKGLEGSVGAQDCERETGYSNAFGGARGGVHTSSDELASCRRAR